MVTRCQDIDAMQRHYLVFTSLSHYIVAIAAIAGNVELAGMRGYPNVAGQASNGYEVQSVPMD